MPLAECARGATCLQDTDDEEEFTHKTLLKHSDAIADIRGGGGGAVEVEAMREALG